MLGLAGLMRGGAADDPEALDAAAHAAVAAAHSAGIGSPAEGAGAALWRRPHMKAIPGLGVASKACLWEGQETRMYAVALCALCKLGTACWALPESCSGLQDRVPSAVRCLAPVPGLLILIFAMERTAWRELISLGLMLPSHVL